MMVAEEESRIASQKAENKRPALEKAQQEMEEETRKEREVCQTTVETNDS